MRWVVVRVMVDRLVEAVCEGVVERILQQRRGEREVRPRHCGEQPPERCAPVAAVLVCKRKQSISQSNPVARDETQPVRKDLDTTGNLSKKAY